MALMTSRQRKRSLRLRLMKLSLQLMKKAPRMLHLRMHLKMLPKILQRIFLLKLQRLK